MHVVVALTKCASYEKRDRMASLLAPISKTTIANEPECLAYAWFKSDADNAVPDRYLRGLEVYENEAALSQTHRSSPEYKEMRSSVIPERITEAPTDLRPLMPTGIGYLNLEDRDVAFDAEASREQIVVVRRFTTADAARRDDLKTKLKDLVENLLSEATDLSGVVKSFWCLEYAADLGDGTIVSFERYVNKVGMERVAGILRDDLDKVEACCVGVEATTWVNVGIGFLRGNVG